MPTYQYLCTDCGDGFDIQQSFTDDALSVCPECDGRLRKVFNAVGVVFKGSGFYKTDSRSNNSAGATSSTEKSASESSSDTGPAKESTPAASTKSETKPAAKKEASAASSAS